MAIQYKDGTFEIGDFEEMKMKFFDFIPTGLVHSFHVGDLTELKERAEEQPIKQRLAKLEKSMKDINTKQSITQSEILALPTEADVKLFG